MHKQHKTHMGVRSPKEKAPKPKYNLWQNSAFMISIAWVRNKSVLWFCLLLAAFAVASSLLGLLVTPTLLEAVENAVPINRLIRIILLFAAGMMTVNALNAYLSTNTLFGRIAVRGMLVSLINEKISKTAYPNTENQEVRKKLDKAQMSVSSNRQATEAIWETLTNLVKNIAGFIIYLLLLTALEPWIIAIVAVTTVTGFFISKRINEWGYRHRDEEAEYSRHMNYISERAADYTLAKDIRVFGMRGWLEDRYNGTLRLYQSFIARGEKVYIWGNVIDIVLTFVRNGAAYIYLLGMVLSHDLSASQFLLYFSLVGGFTAWMSGILSDFAALHTQSLDISAVREFLEYDEPFTFESGCPIEPDTNKPYQLTLRNVSFRYPEADENTLTNMYLTINAGEKLAIVGLNGAGKTTLVKLLCGFYDPTSGDVLMNGENIKQYNRRDYYRHFSAVFQTFSLLATTLTENIAQTDSSADEDKIRRCAEKAGLAEKIEHLPQKYDTHISKEVYEDGITLSGGETQSLMLARALYKDAPIIILDEPTAALDPIAESDMYNKYNDLTRGRTAVFISHRLASTRFCERIILVDNGAIIEEGTHDTLMQHGGKYAALFEVQSHYYREAAVDNVIERAEDRSNEN